MNLPTQADIVVIIVPLTTDTRAMFGATELSLMKHEALLVNAARGPVVVTDALVEALKNDPNPAVRIKAVEELIEGVNRELRAIPNPNPTVFPNEYAAAERVLL